MKSPDSKLAKTGYIYSHDSTALFYRHYVSANKKASVFLLHGLGEHSGRYAHVAEVLIQNGFEVFAIDLRGHGRSEGKRGHVDCFAHYEQDARAGIELARQHQTEGQKLFAVAHSMGGLIALRLLMSGLYLDGLILSCPLFKTSLDIPVWKHLVAKVLEKIVPSLRLSSGITGSQLSTDLSLATSYDTDPLVLRSVSVRAYQEIVRSCEALRNQEAELKHPILLQVAEADPVVDPEAAKSWYERHRRQAYELYFKSYPGFLHEIYNERNRELPIGDAIAWLNQQA